MSDASFIMDCPFCAIEWQVEQLEESIREVEAEGGSDEAGGMDEFERELEGLNG